MKIPLRSIIAILAIQAVLAGLYLLVEYGRPNDVPGEVLSTEPPMVIEGRLESMSVKTADGSLVDLQSVERPTLIHFWATWCRPCLAELPILLRLSKEHEVNVVAVALDDDWREIEQFLGKSPIGSIVLGDASEIESKLGVHSLPVTFLVVPGGWLRLRFDGAKDWANTDFLNTWTSYLTLKGASK